MALIQNKDKASIVAGILVCEEHLNITNALAVAEKQVKLIFGAPATRRCSAHRNHRVVIYSAAHGFAQNRQRRPLIANLFMVEAGRSSLLGRSDLTKSGQQRQDSERGNGQNDSALLVARDEL